jgi:predicted Zn-dependent protease
LLFFNTPELSGASLYCEKSKMLKTELGKSTHLTKLYQDSAKSKFHFNTIEMATIVGAIVIFVSLIVFRGPIFGGIAYLIPFSVEKSIGDSVFNPRMTSEQKETVEQLKLLVSEIKFTDEKWNNQFTVHLSSETVANAYATVGGHIFINKGLVSLVETPEQLLGVVAHEMIHVKNRHVARSVFQSLGLYALLQFLVGDFTGIAAVLVDQGGPLLQLQYSRGLEDEADQEAIKVLIQNRINPIGLSQSLAKMNAESKKLIQQSPTPELLGKLQKIELLSSHPEIEKRIASLLEQAEKLTAEIEIRKLDFDFKKFQSQVKENF